MKLQFDIYKIKEEYKINKFLPSFRESEFIITGKELIEDEELEEIKEYKINRQLLRMNNEDIKETKYYKINQ